MIIPVIAYGILLLGTIVVLFRRLKLFKRMGAREREFSRKSNRQFIGILLCSPLLIVLGYWKQYGSLMMIALSCAGLIAYMVSLSDILFIGIGGLYEKGMVWNTTVVFFDRIRSCAQLDPYTIEIRIPWRSRKVFVFSDTELVKTLYQKLENYPEHLQ